jgi:putative ABC transport system permease protein
VLTGILPKNEFKSKATWQGALGVFSRPEGCGAVPNIPGLTDSRKTQVRKRVIDDLAENAVLVGGDIAQTLKLQGGDSLRLLNRAFVVDAVLPVTGTVDDNRIFAHLYTVQGLTNRKSVLNVIEIVGCCSEISKGLIQKLNKLLPDAKVVTITQIVSTQINTNKMMNDLSLLLLIVIVVIGGASIANYMFANVYERRREIGILTAMGAKPAWIVKLFLLKSLFIGIAGGILGYVLGTLIALVLGPRLAEIPVLPIPVLAVYGIALSVLVSLTASIWPIVRATKVDPHVIMQEE